MARHIGYSDGGGCFGVSYKDRGVDPRAALRALELEFGRGEDRRPNSQRTGDGVRIYAHGATESVGVIAGLLSFSRACARVSILWGDPVGGAAAVE